MADTYLAPACPACNDTRCGPDFHPCTQCADPAGGAAQALPPDASSRVGEAPANAGVGGGLAPPAADVDLPTLALLLPEAIADSGYARTTSWAVSYGNQLINELTAARRWRKALVDFMGVAVTARRHNTDEWMAGVADDINALLADLGDGDRVEFLPRDGGFRINRAQKAEQADA